MTGLREAQAGAVCEGGNRGERCQEPICRKWFLTLFPPWTPFPPEVAGAGPGKVAVGPSRGSENDRGRITMIYEQ